MDIISTSRSVLLTIIVVLLISLPILSVRECRRNNVESEKIIMINKSALDSLNSELVRRSLVIDSLTKCIDSFKFSYDRISDKYNIMKDSIRTLDLDGSINFFNLKLYEDSISSSPITNQYPVTLSVP